MEAVLKQKKKKKQKQKKKETKNPDGRLMLGIKSAFNVDEVDEVKHLITKIEEKLLKSFEGHVGEENALTPYELFWKVFRRKADEVDVFKRSYWWHVILRVLHNLRRDNRMFVINKRRYLFVLQSTEEAREFRIRMDHTISAIEKTKKRADAWVDKKLWKRFIK